MNLLILELSYYDIYIYYGMMMNNNKLRIVVQLKEKKRGKYVNRLIK